jgi:DNA-binding CsgD family transcriptional regulator/PAS domain-containing protein
MHRATEALYDAVIDPAAWDDAMRALRALFHSRVEALYCLDLRARALRPVRVEGVERAQIKRFSASFYLPDNPCLKTPELHRPGVVRTDERMLAHLGDPQALRRSTYFNEWLRPQDLAHTMGITPWAEEGLVLNFSLLREPGRGAFGSAEQRRLDRLARHMERAMRMVVKLDTLTQRCSDSTMALDRVAQGMAVLDAQGALLQANQAALRLLARGKGFCLRSGRLAAREPQDQARVDALLNACTAGSTRAEPLQPAALVVQGLVLQMTPLRSTRSVFVSPQAAVLVSLSEPLALPLAQARETLSALFGFTRAEARLALSLMDGGGLREAASRARMSYATARWYLKILFQKTGTTRQSELIALLVRVTQSARPLQTH